ncbi:EVE domain-containing protein [soil metagenome]
MPRYWLMKSEPGSYSIDDLKADRRTSWEGVRNYQARNFLRDLFQIGDEVLFYHSNADPPGVVGLARVVREGYPDPAAHDPKSDYFDARASEDDPRWYMVDIEFVEAFETLIPLAAIRDAPSLQNMPLNNRSRLSVQPVTPEQFQIILAMARSPRS